MLLEKKERKRTVTSVLAVTLILSVVLGCRDKSQINLSEACNYLSDTGMTVQMSKQSCGMSGKSLSSDGKIKNQAGDFYISYNVRQSPDRIRLTINRNGDERRIKGIFKDYCEKLFQRALNVSLPEKFNNPLSDDIRGVRSFGDDIQSPKFKNPAHIIMNFGISEFEFEITFK